MIKKIPDGAGCVMLDAGYDANENYRMIRNTGRRPVICTRKNHIAKGFDPRTKMLRWQERNPEEFEDTYHQRSIVESVFSSFKCRFTAGCSCKEAGNAKTAAAPQVHLLQSVVIVEQCKKHVLCV